MSLHKLSLSEAAALMRSKQLSPIEYMEAILDRIDALEKEVKAFVELRPDEARHAARRASDEMAANEYKGDLHGIPIAIKDIIDVHGWSTRAGVLADGRVAARSATVVERLIDAGGIVIGKTNTHELALGVTTPPTRNPWDLSRIPGGSSGGSAAAVASGMVPLALGSDTGGSIRIPASLCGIAGLLPSYGLVPRTGVVSNTWSFDCVGPLARTTKDAAIGLTSIVGSDPSDPVSVEVSSDDYISACSLDISGVVVGIPSNYFTEKIERPIREGFVEAVESMTEMGAVVEEVTIPYEDYYLPLMFGITIPEIAAYHEASEFRIDGSISRGVSDLLDAGLVIQAVDYIHALRVRGVVVEAWKRLFSSIDVLLTPTLPAAAVPIGEEEVVWPDGSRESLMELYPRFTCPANVVGACAVSVCGGITEAELPFGIQVIARPFDEPNVFRVAAALERRAALMAGSSMRKALES